MTSPIFTKEQFLDYLQHDKSTPEEYKALFDVARRAANSSIDNNLLEKGVTLDPKDPLTQKEAQAYVDRISTLISKDDQVSVEEVEKDFNNFYGRLNENLDSFSSQKISLVKEINSLTAQFSNMLESSRTPDEQQKIDKLKNQKAEIVGKIGEIQATRINISAYFSEKK